MVRVLKTKLAAGVVDVFKDRAGRTVTLTEERWKHIVEGHPAMEGLDLAVKRAVENADEVRRGNGPGIEVVYGRNLGPTRWLAVVVAYDQSKSGKILTAYPQTNDPKPDQKESEATT